MKLQNIFYTMIVFGSITSIKAGFGSSFAGGMFGSFVGTSYAHALADKPYRYRHIYHTQPRRVTYVTYVECPEEYDEYYEESYLDDSCDCCHCHNHHETVIYETHTEVDPGATLAAGIIGAGIGAAVVAATID